MTTQGKSNDENQDTVVELEGQHKITPQQLTYKDRPPHDYDTEALNDFLGLCFADVTPGDPENNILGWFVERGAPGMPTSEDALMKRLARTKKAAALYVNTSTFRKADGEKLRNRQELFAGLHFVVLDDIGTKIDPATLPEAVQTPTFVVESSAGNFQYGYVLQEPIKDLELAKAFVQLVYTSGHTDKGGAMVNKLVRLPDGINGKKGEKELFKVNLRQSSPDTLWTPESLLDALGVVVDWEEVKNDVTIARKRHHSYKSGAVAWSSTPAKYVTPDGLVDPVLEWLAENDMIVNDNGLWVEIICPWHGNHTSGGDTAGYSTIGRGSRPEEELRRGFKCFHDSCADKRTPEFLDWVAASGGPHMPVMDLVAPMVSRYIFDAHNNGVWDIQDPLAPVFSHINAFRNLECGEIAVFEGGGKPRKVTKVGAWLNHPARVSVMGERYAPDCPDRIIEQGPHKFFNRTVQPDWGDGDIGDQANVQRFLDFMEYLLPVADERDYVIDTLAAKAQNLGFRGNAILFVSSAAQGTGRGTLFEMIKTLFKPINCEFVPFKEYAGGGQYNEWMERPIVFTNEIRDTGTGATKFQAYEYMKDVIDPLPAPKRINPKYGVQRESMVHSTYFLATNHANAIAIPADDRRLMVVTHYGKPAAPEYFRDLHKWLRSEDADGRSMWAADIWRYLRGREVDVDALVAPAPMTPGKKAMVRMATSDVRHVLNAILDVWPSPIVYPDTVRAIIERDFYTALKLDRQPEWEKQVKIELNNLTHATNTKTQISYKGKRIRPRISARALLGHEDEAALTRLMQQTETDDDMKVFKAEVRKLSKRLDGLNFVEAVADILDIDGA